MGDYGQDLRHTKVSDGLRGFQHELAAAEDEIIGRNRWRPHTYDYLRPSVVPSSTNI